MSALSSRPGVMGSFLRARRALVSPESAGFVSGGGRHVSGLRRDEVALLAGISTDYYTRLEQGRERHPSPSVVDGLARALLLGADDHDHLIQLAANPPPDPTPPRNSATIDGLRALVDRWSSNPAMVVDGKLDVLVRNPLAEALFGATDYPDNLARLAFLGSPVRGVVEDRDEFARCAAATLRSAVVTDVLDPGLADLVDELTRCSDDFARLWTEQRVHRMRSTVKRLRHPIVGSLQLHLHVLLVGDEPGLQLWVYRAEPGSPSARSLLRLAVVAAH